MEGELQQSRAQFRAFYPSLRGHGEAFCMRRNYSFVNYWGVVLLGTGVW